MRIIYTSKGMSKKFGVRVIDRKIRYFVIYTILVLNGSRPLNAIDFVFCTVNVVTYMHVTLPGCTASVPFVSAVWAKTEYLLYVVTRRSKLHND